MYVKQLIQCLTYSRQYMNYTYVYVSSGIYLLSVCLSIIHPSIHLFFYHQSIYLPVMCDWSKLNPLCFPDDLEAMNKEVSS